MPLPYSWGRYTRYSDRMYYFSVTIPRCHKDVYLNSFFSCSTWLWNSLPMECLTYDITSFQSRINRHQCQIQSIFGDTVYLCYCKLRLVTPSWWGLRGWKIFILIALDRWKRHFREKNYIENYFYLLKSTKSTKTTFRKCWRNIIWVDFFGCPYRTNGIKTHLGSLLGTF